MADPEEDIFGFEESEPQQNNGIPTQEQHDTVNHVHTDGLLSQNLGMLKAIDLSSSWQDSMNLIDNDAYDVFVEEEIMGLEKKDAGDDAQVRIRNGNGNDEIKSKKLQKVHIEEKNTNQDINEQIDQETLLVPPENFSPVCGEIYRSSFPRPENFEFMKRKLGLKTIICLVSDEYPQDNLNYLEENGVSLHQVGLSGNKEPFVKIKPELVTQALKIILNPENQPILIHCNRGKHRTGCIVGCIRKLQKWSSSMIFDEYRRFAYPKERPLDQQFIEMYDDHDISLFVNELNWLPKW